MPRAFRLRCTLPIRISVTPRYPMNSKHLALPSIGLSGSCNPLIRLPFQKFETHISINFRIFAAGTKTPHTMHGKVQFCLDANGLPVACTSVEEDLHILRKHQCRKHVTADCSKASSSIAAESICYIINNSFLTGSSEAPLVG